MRALIFAGQIVDVAAADFPVHPSMQWVAAPADVSMATHVFNGVAVVLRAPKTPAEIAAADSAAAKRELAAIDLASIRAMREWIAAQPTAPQSLKDREAAALLARGRVI